MFWVLCSIAGIGGAFYGGYNRAKYGRLLIEHKRLLGGYNNQEKKILLLSEAVVEQNT